MTETTKTVSGYFGEKQITKADYVKEWNSSFSQFFHLANTPTEFDELKTMQQRLRQLAEQKWESLKS